MPLYADENFPLDVVIVLRGLGQDVLTAQEDGRGNQRIPDEQVLERATELERAILTINRIDFRRMHYQQSNHAGIIICTFDADFTGQAKRIAAAIEQAGELSGQLIRVYRPA